MKTSIMTIENIQGNFCVITTNCSEKVNELIQKFSTGGSTFTKHPTRREHEVWHECTIEFNRMISSKDGQAIFKQMGVKKFYIDHEGAFAEEQSRCAALKASVKHLKF